MKKLIPILITGIPLIINAKTKESIIKDHLKNQLSTVLQENRKILGQKASEEELRVLDFAAENFDQQLDYVKTLADNKIQANAVNHQFETAILTQKNTQLCAELADFYAKSQPKQPAIDFSWDEIDALVLKILDVLRKGVDRQQLLDDLRGLVSAPILQAWEGYEAAQVKNLTANPQIAWIQKSASVATLYIFGDGIAALLTFKKGPFGPFLSNYSETSNLALIQRLRKI